MLLVRLAQSVLCLLDFVVDLWLWNIDFVVDLRQWNNFNPV
jgi:hypothetical protein